jgi:translation initiation factor IF-2
MSVTPTAHGASHGAGGNDPIATLALSGGMITFTALETAPATPAAGTVVLYAVEDGLGHSLSIKFDDGSVVELGDNV